MNNPFSFLRGQQSGVPYQPLSMMAGQPFGSEGSFYPPSPIHPGYPHFYPGSSDQVPAIPNLNHPSNQRYFLSHYFDPNGIMGRQNPETYNNGLVQTSSNPQDTHVQNGEGRDANSSALPRPNVPLRGSTLWRLVSPSSVNEMFPIESYKVTVKNVNICVKLHNIVDLFQKVGDLKAAAFISPGQVEITYWKQAHCKKAVAAYHDNYYFGSKLEVYTDDHHHERTESSQSAERQECTSTRERRKRKSECRKLPKSSKIPLLSPFDIKREEAYTSEDTDDGVVIKTENEETT